MSTPRCSRIGSAAPLVFVLAMVCAGPALAQEDSRWITDQFEITMRTGKSTKQSIVRMLSSGTRVELLELDREAGYALVRTPGGTEGWVLSRYLLSEPPALVTLPQLQQRLAEGDSGLQRLTNENQALKKENRDLARQIAELQRDGSRLQNELGEIRELSSNVIQVDEQNRQLSQRLAETEQLLQEMRADNQKLASRSNREWFIVGAAVLFIGMAMGLILPRIRWKKKSSWSDF